MKNLEREANWRGTRQAGALGLEAPCPPARAAPLGMAETPTLWASADLLESTNIDEMAHAPQVTIVPSPGGGGGGEGGGEGLIKILRGKPTRFRVIPGSALLGWRKEPPPLKNCSPPKFRDASALTRSPTPPRSPGASGAWDQEEWFPPKRIYRSRVTRHCSARPSATLRRFATTTIIKLHVLSWTWHSPTFPSTPLQLLACWRLRANCTSILPYSQKSDRRTRAAGMFSGTTTRGRPAAMCLDRPHTRS